MIYLTYLFAALTFAYIFTVFSTKNSNERKYDYLKAGLSASLAVLSLIIAYLIL